MKNSNKFIWTPVLNTTLLLLMVSLCTLCHLQFATIFLSYFTMLSVFGLHRSTLYFDYEQQNSTSYTIGSAGSGFHLFGCIGTYKLKQMRERPASKLDTTKYGALLRNIRSVSGLYL
jgi:hypothetical protein